MYFAMCFRSAMSIKWYEVSEVISLRCKRVGPRVGGEHVYTACIYIYIKVYIVCDIQNNTTQVWELQPVAKCLFKGLPIGGQTTILPLSHH